MDLVDLVILGLAVGRLSRMLAYVDEGGPWNILHKLRHLIGVRYDEQSNPYGTNTFANGALCVVCNSVWFGVFVAVTYAIIPELAVLIFLPLALSDIAILLEK
jgi:hypothetical protein